MKQFSWLLIATLVTSTTLGGALPPSSAKPLSAILEALVASGYDQITDVEFDHGRWQIEAMSKAKPVEVFLDPQTATVVHEETDDRHAALPANSKPLADIVEQLERNGYLAFSEVELEGDCWKVEATRSGQRYEVLVNTVSGQVVSERLSHD